MPAESERRQKARQQAVDELHRAIGRFVVEFSQMLHGIEVHTVIALSPTGDQGRINTLLANRGAQRILDDFFNLLGQMRARQWTDVDKAIVTAFRREANVLVAERNRIAHDAWFVGWGNENTTDWIEAQRVQATAGKDGASVREHALTAKDLEALTDRVTALREVEGLFAMEFMHGTRPSVNFCLDDAGRAVRRTLPDG